MVLGRRQMQRGPLVEVPHVHVRVRRREAIFHISHIQLFYSMLVESSESSVSGAAPVGSV